MRDIRFLVLLAMLLSMIIVGYLEGQDQEIQEQLQREYEQEHMPLHCDADWQVMAQAVSERHQAFHINGK